VTDRRRSAHTGSVSPSPGPRADRAARFLATPTDNAAEQDARRVWRESTSDDPRESLQVILERLGHRGAVIEQTVSLSRWFSWCECGWVSSTTNTESDAAGAVNHHVRQVLRDYRRRALPLSAYPEPRETDWEMVRRRRPHWALKRREEGTWPAPRGVVLESAPEIARRVAG
jgi:hypothetical protein